MFDNRNADRIIQGQATHTATRDTNRGLMMSTATNANPELKKSESTGGFNSASGGNRKYIAGRSCWSVFYTDASGYRAELCFKRKCDALAVFGWMLATDWCGAGDYEGQFMSWAIANRHAVASTFKGEM